MPNLDELYNSTPPPPEVLVRRVPSRVLSTEDKISQEPSPLKRLLLHVINGFASDPSGGVSPMAMAAAGETQIAKRALSATEQSGIVDRLMTKLMGMGRAMGSSRQELADQLEGDSMLHLSEHLQEGIPSNITNPENVDNYLFTVIRNRLRHTATDMGAALSRESETIDPVSGVIGSTIGDEGGGTIGRQIASVAPSQVTSDVVERGGIESLPKTMQSLVRSRMMQGASTQTIRDTSGKAFGSDEFNAAIQSLDHINFTSPAQQLSTLGYSPGMIKDAISQVVKSAPPGGLRNFSHPTERYLLEDLSPGVIAKGLGYKTTDLPTFNRRLMGVTKRVLEYLANQPKRPSP